MQGKPEGQLAWHRGRECDGGACVEAAAIDDTVFVRSSADPDGATLLLSRHEWREFLVSAKAGHFDAL